VSSSYEHVNEHSNLMKCGIYLSKCATVDFSRRTQLCGESKQVSCKNWRGIKW
jgi:hypothetical protein